MRRISTSLPTKSVENARAAGAARGDPVTRASCLPLGRCRIKFPVASNAYAPRQQDIHRLANKICGQVAGNCIAEVGNAGPPRIRRGAALASCPIRASQPEIVRDQ
ncbi:hypothetical protein [Burkholderia ubonensis]|uniref:hypothetical protein n=1 Tax=Burkholderia ubonensis TaxID=101571 RepID=UPI0012F9F48E|nr:hypothetical protein [Burkholderia ubonensis]